MSFGPKLDQLPVECPPGAEIAATLRFVPSDEDFEQHLTIYVEEAAGIRLMKVRVKCIAQGGAS